MSQRKVLRLDPISGTALFDCEDLRIVENMDHRGFLCHSTFELSQISTTPLTTILKDKTAYNTHKEQNR